MRYLLRQIGTTFLSVSLLYGFAIVASYVVAPSPPQTGTMDTWEIAQKSIYLSIPKYVLLGRDVLNIPEKKVILVGASNTGGFRQNTLQSLIPCAKVSNIGVGRANISEVQQTIDLVHEVQDLPSRNSNTFVIGVWYGMFVDSDVEWPGIGRQRGDTDLDVEKYRYGFYRRSPAGPVAVLPPHWLAAGIVLIRPYLLVEKLARDLTGNIRQALFVRPHDLTDEEREKLQVSEADKTRYLTEIDDSMGNAHTISLSQVNILQQTIEGLLKHGERVVLVDLPLPTWHADASPYEPSYRLLVRKGVFDRFAHTPGFTALAMDDLADEQNYADDVHPKPHVAKLWAERLANVLTPQVCSEPSVYATKVPDEPYPRPHRD